MFARTRINLGWYLNWCYSFWQREVGLKYGRVCFGCCTTSDAVQHACVRLLHIIRGARAATACRSYQRCHQLYAAGLGDAVEKILSSMEHANLAACSILSLLVSSSGLYILLVVGRTMRKTCTKNDEKSM
jgi:hypothetical protein